MKLSIDGPLIPKSIDLYLFSRYYLVVYPKGIEAIRTSTVYVSKYFGTLIATVMVKTGIKSLVILLRVDWVLTVAL